MIFLKKKKIVHTFFLLGCLAAFFSHNSLIKAMMISEEEQLRNEWKTRKIFSYRKQEKKLIDDIFIDKTRYDLLNSLDLALFFNKGGYRLPCQQTLLKEREKRKEGKVAREVEDVKIQMEILNEINSKDINNRNELIKSLSLENIKLKKKIELLNEEGFSHNSCFQILKSAFKRFWYGSW